MVEDGVDMGMILTMVSFNGFKSHAYTTGVSVEYSLQ